MCKEHYIQSGLNFAPHFDHLFFFNKQTLTDDVEKTSDELRDLLKDSHSYEQFIKLKERRPNFDIYACFQAFNEATKALFPFLKELQKEVQPNDIILNLWDRSGWLTSLLCGLFPEQKIITTWEGDKDVLGYKGFHYWMKSHSNLEIVFHDPNKPLPFTENSITCSIGLDLLHRFDQFLTLTELNRVVKPSGVILFPHVHLSNNEPNPYFDRGGIQLHGKRYEEIFSSIFDNTHRTGYIFSEPQLFIENDIKRSSHIPLESTPDTPDYNGLVAILPQEWKTKTLSAYSMNDIKNVENAYILVNCLLSINLSTQSVSIDRSALEGQLGYLLDRHPIYVERINTLDGFQLTELATQCIYLAQKAYSIKEISEFTKQSVEVICNELKTLEELGLLQVLPISKDSIRLQYYLMSQRYIMTDEEQSFPHFWKKTVNQYGQSVALISQQDESEFTYEDCHEIVHSICLRLTEQGLKKGDRILICSKMHTEPIFLLWACLNLGIAVVPINADLPLSQIEYIIQETNVKLCFFGQSAYNTKLNLEGCSLIIFDEEEPLEELLYFSDWIDQVGSETILNNTNITSKDNAVILFTSGSTGQPKGVQLSHGNLIRSGRLITETFHWKTEDRFYNLGTLNTMSGLRNSSISSLHVGGCVVIPNESTLDNILAVSESIHDSQANILGSNPTFLRQLVNYKTKIKGQIRSVKTVICTGNTLSDELRADFLSAYKLPIYNYYGLTETTGICTAQHIAEELEAINTIGRPIHSIAQIVDESGKIVTLNKQGELRIFSDNLMQGYLNNEQLTQEVIKNGWFYTNDLVQYTPQGNIELIGRKKTIIKTKTEELIHLSEVKTYIDKLQQVKDSFIQPIKKGELEEFVAFIALKDSSTIEHSFIDKTKQSISTDLGKHKIPSRFIILPELPYNFDGKILVKSLLNHINES